MVCDKPIKFIHYKLHNISIWQNMTAGLSFLALLSMQYKDKQKNDFYTEQPSLTNKAIILAV